MCVCWCRMFYISWRKKVLRLNDSYLRLFIPYFVYTSYGSHSVFPAHINVFKKCVCCSYGKRKRERDRKKIFSFFFCKYFVISTIYSLHNLWLNIWMNESDKLSIYKRIEEKICSTSKERSHNIFVYRCEMRRMKRKHYIINEQHK